MVAKITTGKSMIGLINYNEQKVEKGDARLIFAENMVLGKRADELSYAMKVGTFERIINGKKNHRLDKTTFHASLNFDLTEKLTDQTLKEVARKYMEGMGYGNQPFLVYRHEDTHHPHIHIVSVKVDREGKKVEDSFYKLRSEEVRKALEIEYELVKASEKIKHSVEPLRPLDPMVIEYGKGETKAAISQLVSRVVEDYKLTSLKELQTVLNQFNIQVEHVKGVSPKDTYEGLVYSVTNEKGDRMGVGIKASSIYSQPTMTHLTPQFKQNKEAKKGLVKETAGMIAQVFRSHFSLTPTDFQQKLAAQGIVVLYHQGEKGIYGVSFVDHARKVVFKGSELGKEYSWNALQKRLSDNTQEKQPNLFPDSAIFKQATAALATIYSQLKKDPDVGAYFESVFIQKLSSIDLATTLLKSKPELSPVQAEQISRQFKSFKESKLPEIKQKEQHYFQTQLQMAIRFIDQGGTASPTDKLSFLYRYQLALSQQDGQVTIHHRQGEHLKITVPEAHLQKLFGNPFPIMDVQHPKTYTKAERAFIAGIVSGKPVLQGLTLFNFRYSHFQPFLSDANRTRVAQHLTRAYLAEINPVLGTFPSVVAMVTALDKRGIQIVPLKENGIVKDYTMRYYHLPEGKIPVQPAMKAQLLKADYQAEPKAITPQYTLLVGLQQSLDRKEEKGAEKALNLLDKYNPVLSRALRKEMIPLKEAHAKEDTKSSQTSLGLKLIGFLIDRIQGYPSEQLREVNTPIMTDKSGLSPSSASTPASKSTSITLVDAFNGGRTAGNGPDSHHSRNKKRKRNSGLS